MWMVISWTNDLLYFYKCSFEPQGQLEHWIIQNEFQYFLGIKVPAKYGKQKHVDVVSLTI